MKIILAPDSFKESLSAVQVCAAMTRGIRAAAPHAEIIAIPLADGGEGTTETLTAAADGEMRQARVTGPLGQPLVAHYGLIDGGDTAVIEMAQASGLQRVAQNQRNPLHTTTFGTGELIRAAIEDGVRRLIIGIGGSATNDGGAGMAQALGVKFYQNNKEITQPLTGALLAAITDIDVASLDPRMQNVKIRVACDVDNPLLGERGAAGVYAPQKGADAESVAQLEKNMARFYDLVESRTRSVRNIAGAGAAGGLGAGLMAFLNAELGAGIDIILSACRFDERIQQADLILTGEGKIDRQTIMGKTISGVLQRAAKQNIPVVAVSGALSTEAEELYSRGMLSMFSICDAPMPLSEAIKNADRLIAKACERITRLRFF